jgi:Fe-S cluster assembly ATP-binding protein
MLKLKDVSATINAVPVLNNINLEVKSGEIHAIMGPKGSGKSSLAQLIQGNPFVELTEGTILFRNKNINRYTPNKRSQLGVFSTFQHPPEIEGLTNLEMIKAIVKSRTGGKYNAEFEETYKILLKTIGLDSRFVDDPVNTESRSVADWRKGEVVQALMIQPSLLILDEIDSEVDDESLDYIIAMVHGFLEVKARALIVITHSKKLLDKLNPDYFHVMVDGEISEEGGREFYKRIEEHGNT